MRCARLGTRCGRLRRSHFQQDSGQNRFRRRTRWEKEEFEEWTAGASVFRFEILPRPSERLYTQKT